MKRNKHIISSLLTFAGIACSFALYKVILILVSITSSQPTKYVLDSGFSFACSQQIQKNCIKNAHLNPEQLLHILKKQFPVAHVSQLTTPQEKKFIIESDLGTLVLNKKRTNIS